ncbi:response regulator [Cryptosporangium sp. NPDC051539]|uniref:response regulator n=1 Tax=Cryptosporangium sp. NPDC051539 TaxID=3363962 RepID=UPI0037B20139
MPIRVLLVDDHEMILRGLEAMLQRFTDQVAVVGAVSDVAAAVRLAVESAPDVVLSDLRLGKNSGLDLCTALRTAAPTVRVVFLTVYDDEQHLFQALRAGAAGYLLKRVDGPELVRHLHSVRDGEVVIDPTMAGRVAASAAHLHNGEFWPGARLGLTQRESEVLALLVGGLSNRAIAGRLVVSDDTVKTHLRGLYRKLAVNDRSGAVATALREGLFR